MLATGCTKNFDNINTDPTKASPANFDPNYFLSTSQWTYVDGITGYAPATATALVQRLIELKVEGKL